ncbi:MAG: DUF4352 domain-containing protein [Lachnospiraceae bacterium]|nr:DUF4352 domain-containing protein [Lachnospiraceae bacterium]MBQ3664944.1 DUF4352 domain-containing protein [Lachnospiraceae bacterium]
MGEEQKNTKMKTCKYCQSEIPAKAKICPNCRKKQKGKGKWIVVAVIILLIAAAAGSGSDKDGPKKVGEVSGKSSENGNSGNVEISDDQSQGAKEDGFNVGDIVESDHLRITFLSASDYTSDNQFIQPKDGYKYIRAEFEFENVGKDDEYVSEFDFSCYADGYDMESKYFDDLSISATLSPGRKSKGAVFYEVPVDAKEIILEYETNVWNDKKVIFNVLKTE